MGPVEKVKAGNTDDLFAASQKLLAQATEMETEKKQETETNIALQKAGALVQPVLNETEMSQSKLAQ